LRFARGLIRRDALADDQISGWEVSGCEFHGAKTGIAFAGGRHNVARRNWFYDCATMEHEGTPQQCCGACVVLDNRGMNWEHTDCNTTLPIRVKELLYPGSPWGTRCKLLPTTSPLFPLASQEFVYPSRSRAAQHHDGS
jgi:hypothetical protein